MRCVRGTARAGSGPCPPTWGWPRGAAGRDRPPAEGGGASSAAGAGARFLSPGALLLREEGRQDLLGIGVEGLPVEGHSKGDVQADRPRFLVLARPVDHLLRRADEEAADPLLERRPPLGLHPLFLPLRRLLGGAHVEADVDRAEDPGGIAPLLLAPLVQDLALPPEGVGGNVGGVPAVGVLGDRAERPFLSEAADPDPQMPLQRFGITPGLVELEVATAEVRDPLVEEEPQDLNRLFQLVLAHPYALEGEAVPFILTLVPAGPDAALDAPPRDVVDGAERLGQHAGVAIVDAEDEAADADVLRLVGQRRHR